MKGLVRRFSVGGVSYDPAGEFEVQPFSIKREVAETTRTQVYHTESGREGLLTGAIHVEKETDIFSLTRAVGAQVFIEFANGKYFSGPATYTGEAKFSGNAGTFDINFSGKIKEV